MIKQLRQPDNLIQRICPIAFTQPEKKNSLLFELSFRLLYVVQPTKPAFPEKRVTCGGLERP